MLCWLASSGPHGLLASSRPQRPPGRHCSSRPLTGPQLPSNCPAPWPPNPFFLRARLLGVGACKGGPAGQALALAANQVAPRAYRLISPRASRTPFSPPPERSRSIYPYWQPIPRPHRASPSSWPRARQAAAAAQPGGGRSARRTLLGTPPGRAAGSTGWRERSHCAL